MSISNEAYKQAVTTYEAKKLALLGLQLQLLSKEAEIEKRRNQLIDTPTFDSLTNEVKRKAYLSDGLKAENAEKGKLEVEIVKASAELDVAAKWVSFFKHTFIASYTPADQK